MRTLGFGEGRQAEQAMPVGIGPAGPEPCLLLCGPTDEAQTFRSEQAFLGDLKVEDWNQA